MTVLLITIIIIIAFLCSTYGWGSMIARFAYGENDCHWAFLSALGLTCLIFSGGLLNALSLAYKEALYILFGAGIAFVLIDLYQRTRKRAVMTEASSRAPVDLLCYVLSIIIILGSAAFLIATLLPSNIFNFHDDFHLYLVRPFYMLQTGTLGGNPYEILGIESLGTQSFLQAFILMLFPVEFVNGLDAVFCFILSAFLLVAIAKSIQVHGLYLMLSLMALIAINPQTVNIAPLYSGTVMMLGMFIASAQSEGSLHETETGAGLRKTIPLAMFASALISLKMTFVIIVVVYSVLYFSMLLLFTRDRKHTIGRIVCFIASVSLFLLPWAAVYWEKYWHIFQHFLNGNILDTFGTSEVFSLRSSVVQLFSTDTLLYGGSYLDYGLVMIMLFLACVLSVYSFIKNNSSQFKIYTILVFASAISSIVSYFLNTLFFHPETALRYSCPAFIASLPLAALLLGSLLGVFKHNATDSMQNINIKRLIITSTLIILHLLLLVVFSNSLLERVSRAYYKRTTISFPLVDNPAYIKYNTYALSDEARKLVQGIQDITKHEQIILAWISKPFHLDFARNKIYTVSELGLFNPGLDIPRTENPEDIRAYLKKQGVRYVLWEFVGEGMKSNQQLKARLHSPFSTYQKIAEYNMYFRGMLLSIAKASNILYDKDGIVLFDLE